MSVPNTRGILPTVEDFPSEVVTQAIVRDVDLGPGIGVLALITLDNGHDHTKPNTFGPQGLLSLNAALDAVSARAAAGEIAAVGVTGKPFILAAGADLDGAAAAITGAGVDPADARARARQSPGRARPPPMRGRGPSASPRSATRSSGGWASCPCRRSRSSTASR